MNLGKWRRLTTLADPAGLFEILALDHRDSLRAVINPDSPDSVSDAQLTDLKLDLLGRLGNVASGVMLEPEFSIGPAISTNTLPPWTGFTAALEAQGYLADSSVTHTTLLAGWSVEQASKTGASAAKLLVLWNPSLPDACAAQEAVIRDVVADCARWELPLFLEPILKGPKLDPDTVCEMAAHMASLGPDVLKMGIGPMANERAWEQACADMSGAIEGTPWAFLSGGVSFETFTWQLRLALQEGASGFMVGRALWGDYLSAADPDSFATDVLMPRFETLQALNTEFGHPWFERLDPPPPTVMG